eukprot:7169473-Heterocapsa_arctica.AAC.1
MPALAFDDDPPTVTVHPSPPSTPSWPWVLRIAAPLLLPVPSYLALRDAHRSPPRIAILLVFG